MPTESAATFRGFRAPQQDGRTLVEPPWSALPSVIEQNRRLLSDIDYDVQGRSLSYLAASARSELLRRALAYTREYRNVPAAGDGQQPTADRLILSGHQPQLFHPGVWYKNFVLGRLARQIGGVGIHLIIDSDLCRGASIRVPTGSLGEPRVETVPFDEPARDVPYEERTVRDPTTFAGFADRAEGLIAPFVAEPLVRTLWTLVRERHRSERGLGLCLAQGRHLLEASWGNETLELPQSAVCQLAEFAWFVAHLLGQLRRFHAVHNGALAAYRAAHRLRNRAHPVPDLAKSDGWLEAPFWIWTAEDAARRPMFARAHRDCVEITDRGRLRFCLKLTSDGDASQAVERLMDLSAQGVKLRTRALTTTLFARLVLGDLFLHGIGGAKYDQVTDLIIEQFFGITPPAYAMVSATLRLPIDSLPTDASAPRALETQLRGMRFHPEKFLSAAQLNPGDAARAAAIAAEKRRWIEIPKTAANARDRHVAITAANDAMQAFVADELHGLERARDEADHRRRVAAILQSREYGFCLFPASKLNSLMLS